MTANKKPQPENSGDSVPEETEQALCESREWRDLQNAQIDSMMHMWDNPEDDIWNDA